MELLRGMRDKLDKYVNTMSDIVVSMNINGNAVYDFVVLAWMPMANYLMTDIWYFSIRQVHL